MARVRWAAAAALALVTVAAAGAAGSARQTLTPSDEDGAGNFGYSVALSHDGSTALIGGYQDSIGYGAAWVFTHTGASWQQQGNKLMAPDEHGAGWFGQSAALSGDGKTALIGIPQENADTGTARIFVRSGSGWRQQAELNGGGAEDALGLSVALSADGNTALLGAPKRNEVIGGAYVFVRDGSSWKQQGAILSGRSEERRAEFGVSVAIAGDGQTAAVGGPGDNAGAGAVWIFTRSGGRWLPGPKLTATHELGRAQLGYSVALDAGGKTLVVGGFRDHAIAGAAWVFTRTATGWRQAAKLTVPGAGPQSSVGFSVALDGAGDKVLLGGPGARSSAGAAWLFERTGATWKLATTWRGASGAGLGYGVALSADGTTAAAGAPNDAGGGGTVSIQR